jgi:hypothetical protein
MRLSRFRIAVAMIFLWSICSWAQSEPNLETGFKPYGSYQHDDFDSVSLTSPVARSTRNVVMLLFALAYLFSFPAAAMACGAFYELQISMIF